MIVHVLMDNEGMDPTFQTAHGLSFGIEATQGKYLFDFGPHDRFIDNAHKTGFRLEAVQTAVLSHGHYDHAGGLAAFLNINPQANVMIHPLAFEDHYSGQANGDFKYIGIDHSLRDHPSLVMVDHDQCPFPQCTVLTHVVRSEWNPSANLSLFTYRDGKMEPDDFEHEIHLVIQEAGQLVLFCGCGHSGIINILHAVHQRFGRYPDVVFGGLHLHSPSGNTDEQEVYLNHLASFMGKLPTRFYTGHCTGVGPFHFLQQALGSQIQYAQAGRVIDTRESQ
jgi:7,8-dihydropterin-6-yl-methyl-4-(beta-D-ribofuranosyl)aminobenzene 5'-phosphate synthase